MSKVNEKLTEKHRQRDTLGKKLAKKHLQRNKSSEKMIKKHHQREPWIHIAKRDDMVWWKAWLIRLSTIIIAIFLMSSISVLFTKTSYSDIFDNIFLGAFGRVLQGKMSLFWQFLQRTAILLCLSLAVTPAFKMKFWNCGAEGQALIGGLVSIICMMQLGGKISDKLLVPLIVVLSIAAGAIWGVIPAIFKAYYKTNETLFTLMMNYVATQIVAYYIYISANGATTISEVPYGNLPIVGPSEYFLNILIVTGLMILMFLYLKYSKQGYEIQVVGESQNTARYVGINVKKVIIRTMLISGAVCGLAGMLLVAGTDHSINTGTVGGQGFTAIMVSWLGQFNPFIMAFMSALIVFLNKGFSRVATHCGNGLDASFSDIVSGVVILFLVGCEFFIRYSIKIRHTKKEESV